MLLLVGLGNPGANYAQNRHNAGFHAAMAIATRHNFSPPRQKFNGLLYEGKLGTEKSLILLPQTFYNESGNSVAAAAKFYKIDPEDIIVFHDEIDLPPGKIRLKKGGGLAGNNGLRSTAGHMGPDFWRVRIGVGHPGHKDAVTKWVLGDFSKAEKNDWYEDLLERMADAAPLLANIDEVAAGRFMSALVQPGGKEASPAKPKADTPVQRETPAAKAQKDAGEKAEKSSPFDLLKKLKRD